MNAFNIQFDYKLIVMDVMGPLDESDLLDVVGPSGMNKIKQIIHGMARGQVTQINPIESNRPSLKGYEYRLVACNGDCGSKFAKFVDKHLHQKVCNSYFYVMPLDPLL